MDMHATQRGFKRPDMLGPPLDMRHRARMVTVVFALCVGASEAVAQERHWLPAPVEDAAIVDDDGTLFGYPGRLVASPRGGFVLYDQGAATFREFSATLDLLWESGIRGNGPGEFQRPLDFEFDEAGNLMVVDVDNARLTLLGADGKLIDTHRLPQARQILPKGFSGETDSWVVMPNGRVARLDTLWVTRNGPNAFEAMPSAVDFTASIVGESWAANLKSGGAVIVFRWSGLMIWLEPDGSVRSVTGGVEPMEFPEPLNIDEVLPGGGRIRGQKVDPTAIPVTTDQPARDADHVYMRVLGSTENSRRIVDTYDIDNGEYQGSYLLPHAVAAIAVLEDGRMATLETDFIPTVRLWKMR